MTLEVDITVLEEKIRNLECPFCDFKAKSARGYVWHMMKKHPLKTCPVCGYRGKVVQHLSRRKDREHQLLWAIYGSNRKGTKRRPKRLIELRIELWGVEPSTEI